MRGNSCSRYPCLLAAAQAAKCLPTEAMHKKREPRRVKPQYYLCIEKGPRIFVRGLFCVVDRFWQRCYYGFVDVIVQINPGLSDLRREK